MFKNKICLVTGGASGIGEAASLAFSSEGALVIIADKNKSAGLNVYDKIITENGAADFFEVDLANPDSVDDLFSYIHKNYRTLDIAFNNAGIAMELKPFAETTWDDWQKIIQNNLSSMFLCLKHELNIMQNQKNGCIVNTSSIASVKGFANGGIYSASKAGINLLSRSLAQEYAEFGIRINVICPGFIDTPMSRQCAVDNPSFFCGTEQLTAMKRSGKSKEVAETAVWLCSEKSSFITGEIITVDGGYLA